MAELFGFSIKKSDKSGTEKSFVSPAPDDGSVEIAGGGFFGQVLNVDGREKSELDLIKRYRDIAQQSECDTAIEDIVNEGIVSNQADQAVQVTLDRLPYPEKIKSINLDKMPIVSGTLTGIKGQYLYFDNEKVLNIRKHQGYEVDFSF